MMKIEERGCTFYVCGFVTDGKCDYGFLGEVDKMNAEMASKWTEEIRAGFNAPHGGKPVSRYSPGCDTEDHGQLVIVCQTVDELRVCLNAMHKANIYSPSVFATTDGHMTENTASATLRLFHGGTYTQAAPPKSGRPPLPGLQLARDMIMAEIEKLGGSNGY